MSLTCPVYHRSLGLAVVSIDNTHPHHIPPTYAFRTAFKRKVPLSDRRAA